MLLTGLLPNLLQNYQKAFPSKAYDSFWLMFGKKSGILHGFSIHFQQRLVNQYSEPSRVLGNFLVSFRSEKRKFTLRDIYKQNLQYCEH